MACGPRASTVLFFKFAGARCLECRVDSFAVVEKLKSSLLRQVEICRFKSETCTGRKKKKNIERVYGSKRVMSSRVRFHDVRTKREASSLCCLDVCFAGVYQPGSRTLPRESVFSIRPPDESFFSLVVAVGFFPCTIHTSCRTRYAAAAMRRVFNILYGCLLNGSLDRSGCALQRLLS